MSGLPADIVKGLAHVGPRAEDVGIAASEDVRRIDLLRRGVGSARSCISGFCERQASKALVTWFRDHDLERFRQHAYAAAKAEWMLFQFEYNWTAFKPLWPLLSNHPRMIARFVEYSAPSATEMERGASTTQIDYWFVTVQLLLCNRPGDWTRVIERCDHILANPPRKAWEKYQIDYEIMRAMAQRDTAGLVEAMNVLCSPKYQRKRNYEFPFGLTEHFIGTQAVVYAKMAWYHGMEIEIDTPSIPREWLPMTPAASYPEPYEYFEQFDIEATLEWKGG